MRRILARLRPRVPELVVAACMLGAAYALKRAYASAGADALEWVLVPSCALARLAGLDLVYEPGAGFITHAPRMVVGASCAGVNFLVVAWLAFYFRAQAALPGFARKLAWLGIAGLLAYVATLGTNALRIVLAAELYASDLHNGLFTPARVHRALGIVLYCTVLLGACGLIQHAFVLRDGQSMRRDLLSRPWARLAPLGWYFGVVLLVPLLNRAFVHTPARFAEHAATTLLLGGAVATLCLLWDRLCSPSRKRGASPAP